MSAVTIVGVTWNSQRVLPRWIDSVIAESRIRAAPTELLVVDNASQDESRRLVQSAGIKVVNTGRNLGYAAAINVAYDAVAADRHMLILNPDTVLHPGCVDELVSELAQPSVGLVVPRIVDEAGRTQTSLRRFPTPLRAWGEALLGGGRVARWPALSGTIASGPDYDKPRDIAWATGAAVLVSAAARRSLGHWDATYFLYSEETEYMMRAHAAGVRARYRPSAVVTHTEGEMMTSPELWALSVRNRIALFRRRRPAVQSLCYQAGVTLNEFLRAGSAMHRAGLWAAIEPSRVPDGPMAGIVFDPGPDRCQHSDLVRSLANERPVLFVGSPGDAPRSPLPGRHGMGSASPRRVHRRANWYLLGSPHVIMCRTDGPPILPSSQRRSLILLRGSGDSPHEEKTHLLRIADLVCYTSPTLMAQESVLVGRRGRLLPRGHVDATGHLLLNLIDGLNTG